MPTSAGRAGHRPSSDDPVLVVGAGVVGLVAALALARAGHAVTVLEADGPDLPSACSAHGGGMLAPVSELDQAEPALARAGLDAPERWAVLLGAHPALSRQGSLLVAHRPEWPLLAQLAERVSRAGLRDRIEEVDSAGIGALEPRLAGRFHRGLYVPSEGVVHPRQLLPALRDALAAAGGTLRWHTPARAVQAGRVDTDDGPITAPWVIDARGLGARDALPLRPVRGEYVVLRTPEVSLSRPVRVAHPRYPLYLVPRPEPFLYIGATSVESGQAGAPHARSVLELLSAAYSADPALADAEVVALGVGLRPALPDNLPRVAVSPGHIAINGLYRHGFLLAPLLAAAAVAAVRGATAPAPAQPFVVEGACAS